MKRSPRHDRRVTKALPHVVACRRPVHAENRGHGSRHALGREPLGGVRGLGVEVGEVHRYILLGLILFAVGALLGCCVFFGTLVVARNENTYEGSLPLVTFGAVMDAAAVTDSQ